MANAGFVSPLPVLKSVQAPGPSRCRTSPRYAFPARQARAAPARMTLDAGAAPATATSIADCKAALRSAVQDLDYGRAVLDDEAAQERVDALIQSLESLNPTPDPADDALRRARWKLVYTNSPIVLGQNRPGFARPEKSWQTLDMVDGEDEGRVVNEEEGAIRFLGRDWRWRNQIVGICRSLRGERIRLKFEKFTLGKFFAVPFPGPVVGWQDQTFLDEELRVARTHYGNVFVLERDEWDA